MKIKLIILDVCEFLSLTFFSVCAAYLIIYFAYHFDVENELSKLPASCTSEIENWTINIASYKDMEAAHLGDNPALAKDTIIGLTIVSDKLVMLSSVDYEAHLAFPHEIGHVCDANHDFPSRDEEFYEIYLKEATGYGASDTYEFFAEVYKDIVNGHPSKKTPLANEFVSKYISFD